MNIKNRPPVFVPRRYWPEMEQWSKATLMDMAWDLAQRACAGDGSQLEAIMTEVRSTADIISLYRDQESVAR